MSNERTADESPAPLVDREVDLRGYDFMPLHGDRLFSSETWIAATPEAKIAALRLWWHAYAKEVPAGSLPDNDQLLADYAGYGVAIKAWKRIRPSALRGWIKCTDGRLYHRFLADVVAEAWEKRIYERQRKANWRAAKGSNGRGRDGDVPGTSRGRDGDVPVHEYGTERGRPGSVPVEAKLSEVEAKESELQNRDSGVIQPSTPDAAAGDSAKGAVINIANGKTASPGQNWQSEAWVTATAQRLRVSRREGESYGDWKDRVFEAVRRRTTDAGTASAAAAKG